MNIFKNPNIATRLLFWFGLVGLLPLTLVTFLSYTLASRALTAQINTALETITQNKVLQVESYASERQKDASILSRQPAVISALEKLTRAYESGGVNSADYKSADKEFRAYLTDFAKSYGYADIHLLSRSGDAVFSVKQGKDFDTNFYTGEYKDTELANVFVQSQTLLSAEFSDFKIYPVTNQPAAFVAAPVMKDGTLIGAVVVEVDNTALYSTVNDYSGLGLTGEIVIASKINADTIVYITPLRNDPESAFKRTVTIGSDKGIPIQESIKGVKGSGIDADYRGKEVIASWRYLPGLRWGMVVKIDTEEAFAPIVAQRNAALALGGISLLVVLVVAVLVSRSISRPIVNLTGIAKVIAGGDFNAQAKVETTDEVGALANAFNTMTSQLRNFIGTLEQRVADRTKALATTSEVSRRLSTILNQKELVAAVVNQVNNAFSYYNTQIYFLDADKENLVMAGGTGLAGETMLASGHKIAKGRGLVGRAAESNAPILVSNTTLDENWLPNPLLPETKSEVAIPITLGDEVLGVLDVQQNTAGALKEEDVDSLQSIANQVAVAYQNIRQYENSQKVANDLGVVANVGLATATITDIGQLLQEVVDLSKKSFNLYHAHIYMMNETGDRLELAAGAGEVGRQMVSEKRSIPMDAEQSLVVRAARSLQGVVVNDVTIDPNFLANPLLPDTRAEMAVPMIVGGKVIGVLDVQSETVNRFTDVDVNIKSTLASQIAVAVQNARNFSQSQHQAQRETTVNLITQRIQSATSVEAALQVAARELGHALGMKHTLVSLKTDALAGETNASQVANSQESEPTGTGVS